MRGLKEATVSQQIDLEAPKHGVVLWRNNVGVAVDITGRPVRYGLANVSKAMNTMYKSGDKIGITRRLITPQMVGTVVGIFTSYEIKEELWKFTGTSREIAQQNWNMIVRANYGIAQFVTRPEDIWHVNV